MSDETFNGVKRATGILIIEVVNSNPNGDPDSENDPRQRPNGLGEISPVSFKRKLRDLLEGEDPPFLQCLPDVYKKYRDGHDRYKILESRGRNRKEIEGKMGGKKKEFNQAEFLKSEFVKEYWDARVFGNTFLEKEGNKGFIKSGVVQFGVGVSISPINIIRHTNTNKSGVQSSKSSGMAPLGFRFVEHGVYCMPFYVNPNYAHNTGCTSDDIELMKLLIPHAYNLNRSAARPDVRIRHAWYIEHKNNLGSCADYLLLDALTPKRIGDNTVPSVSWDEYEDKSVLPDNLSEKVGTVIDLTAL